MQRVWGVLPFVLVGVALLLDPATSGPALWNLVTQVVLFTVVAAIPGYLTRHVSYVDVAWPWGLVGIGVVTLLTGSGLTAVLVAAAYLAMGLRMGLWGLLMALKHRWWTPGAPKVELPRYRYQRRRWERQGFRNETLSVQYEIWLQGLANASVLAVPAFVVAADPSRPMSVWFVAALVLWAGSFMLESVADRQKQRFAASGSRGTCDTGLWRYSRHPNYFFQWMQWNALVLLALPSLLKRFESSVVVAVVLTLGLLLVSWTLYVTLTKHTGARPAEFYSVQKRPDYADYQARTNMFFPGPVKTVPAGTSPE
ncbi:DUF1295 domain-containing protein [Lentzea sp. NPDC051838]|uniref:DUF1295 domain-containing protein n=1 Tax=Lentzea sp. NPDC051838 TaxID=3154849 RepID=UPI00342E8E38